MAGYRSISQWMLKVFCFATLFQVACGDTIYQSDCGECTCSTTDSPEDSSADTDTDAEMESDSTSDGTDSDTGSDTDEGLDTSDRFAGPGCGAAPPEAGERTLTFGDQSTPYYVTVPGD